MNQHFRPQGFRILPPVIKNLLIINGIFFLATISLKSAYNIDLVDYLGLHYWASDKFEPWQFITYMFMHSTMNITHLLFNMFALWMFGNALENVWGSKRFLIYYFVTGIGAALVHYIVFYFEISPVIDNINNFIADFQQDPSISKLKSFVISDFYRSIYPEVKIQPQAVLTNYMNTYASEPFAANQYALNFLGTCKQAFLNGPVVIGASGAVYGILLAFGMMFPNALIYLFFLVPIRAKWFVIIFGALELYSGIANNPGDNVAHFAHLGGMIFGFFMIKYWKKH